MCIRDSVPIRNAEGTLAILVERVHKYSNVGEKQLGHLFNVYTIYRIVLVEIPSRDR